MALRPATSSVEFNSRPLRTPSRASNTSRSSSKIYLMRMYEVISLSPHNVSLKGLGITRDISKHINSLFMHALLLLLGSSIQSGRLKTADPNLSSIEIEALLRERVKNNHEQIRQVRRLSCSSCKFTEITVLNYRINVV